MISSLSLSLSLSPSPLHTLSPFSPSLSPAFHMPHIICLKLEFLNTQTQSVSYILDIAQRFVAVLQRCKQCRHAGWSDNNPQTT